MQTVGFEHGALAGAVPSASSACPPLHPTLPGIFRLILEGAAQGRLFQESSPSPTARVRLPLLCSPEVLITRSHYLLGACLLL